MSQESINDSNESKLDRKEELVQLGKNLDTPNIKNEDSADSKVHPKITKPPKPPKPEDKPFDEFMNEELIPKLCKELSDRNVTVNSLLCKKGNRPIVGDECWMLEGYFNNGRSFWLCFNSDNITSKKTIILSETNSEPSLIESFLIDEKKITLPLIVSRLLQRFNGQKWLGNN